MWYSVAPGGWFRSHTAATLLSVMSALGSPISTTVPILPPAPTCPSPASAPMAASRLSPLATATLSGPVCGTPAPVLVKLVCGANATAATPLEISVWFGGSNPLGSRVMCVMAGAATGNRDSRVRAAAPSVADAIASRVPSPWIRASWMPLSGLLVATIACTMPPVSNVSTAVAASSVSKQATPSVAEPAASRVPSPCTRISWMPPPTLLGGVGDKSRKGSRPGLSGYPYEATAMYVPPPISNASTPWAVRSASKPAVPWIAEPAASMVPFSWMRASRMPSLWPAAPPAATATYAPPPISNTSAARPARSRLNPSVLSVTEPTASRRPSSWMRASKMPLV